ncbi:MAG: DcaP family trimeric outer membrane transporter [Rhodopirellula sp. JB044]|uniref:DcaP family trimeric outer membrane transporter n=1 Tax=Rhodopirellula sp. JB044 TaxID=3342844 RepID=UPI00370CAE6B
MLARFGTSANGQDVPTPQRNTENAFANLLQTLPASDSAEETFFASQLSELDPNLNTLDSPVVELSAPPYTSFPADGFSTNSTNPSFASDDFDQSIGNQEQNNFSAFPDFDTGVLVFGDDVALKIGGFVKADFISDFDPINSVDSFDTGEIPVGVADHRNSRFHAKASRLSFDTRWMVQDQVVRAFVEADFFGGADGGNGSFRLRHAYGTMGYFTAGQTWTTFTHPSAVPQTLDFEGAVSNVNRRQGLVCLDLPLGDSGLSWAIALEDPQIDIEIPTGVTGEGRTESPDLITHLKLERDLGDFQAAFVIRELGFQRTGEPVVTDTAWGCNLTGSLGCTDATRVYSQITVGEGIGSYRGSPDVVATGATTAAILPMFGWMIGAKHAWNDQLTSNFTFSALTLDRIAGQAGTNLRETTYLAANLIHNPVDRVFIGIEYLYGTRENQNGEQADATRMQMSFGFYLP